MKPLTLEWIEKAEEDFVSAQRYPGESADKEEAAEALKICRGFRQVARQSLGLRE